MPSPFPGMDPYLESPDWFPDLHNSLIIYMKEALQSSLPEPYYAQCNQRIWVEQTGRRYVEPDVNVLRVSRPARRGGDGGVAVAEVEPPKVGVAEPVVVRVGPAYENEVVENFLEIRTRRGDQIEVITTIEVLSLANKTRGDQGRGLYLQKQREILGSPGHLAEIDLLRGGDHATAVPQQDAVEQAGAFDYHVCVHPAGVPDQFLVYPIRLAERLPTFAVPLRPGVPAVALDLQAAFDRAYDAGPYRRVVRYGEDPIIPPLRPEQADWAAARVEAAHRPPG